SSSKKRVTFAERPKYGSLRTNLLFPLRAKRSWLGTGGRQPEGSVPMEPPRSPTDQQLVKRQQVNSQSPTESLPATPGPVTPRQPPSRPPRPESFFSDPADDLLVVTSQRPSTGTPLPSPSSPAYGRANNPLRLRRPSALSARASQQGQPDDPPRPATPVVVGRQSRWSPDSSPEKQRNPVRRVIGSLTHTAAERIPPIRGVRSSSNMRGTAESPTPAAPQPETDAHPAVEQQQRRTLRHKSSTLLLRLMGRGVEKERKDGKGSDRGGGQGRGGEGGMA
ncbi:hypothetical protein QBC33DRAFT_586447, partial [Phialemonium atrogriseum]